MNVWDLPQFTRSIPLWVETEVWGRLMVTAHLVDMDIVGLGSDSALGSPAMRLGCLCVKRGKTGPTSHDS